MAKVKRLFRFHKSTTDLSEWNKNDDKLLKAVERGDVAKVESLMNRKTLVATKPGPKGMSVFQMAAGSGQLAIVERFLAYGVEINSTDLMGRTALHMAAKLGWPLMVEKLLMMGANQNCVDSDQMSAVHYACGSSHLPCVQSLIQYRANVNCRDKSGRSPLFYCAQSGEVDMCKLLLDHGAEINLKDHFGRTALIFAASKGHREVCELLLNCGANAQCRDQEGLTAVEYSIKAGYTGLQEVFDKIPARASWGVTEGESDTGTPEDMDNNSDIVNPFSVENSPPISAKQSASVKSPKDTSSAPSSPQSPHSGEATAHSPFTSDQRAMDAYKELEEEHELLTEELRTLRVSHIRLQDKLQFLTERSQKSGENGADNQRIQAMENELKKIRHLYSVEQEKNLQLETKLEKNRLQSESPSESPGGVDSWGDSDDDLFGNPAEKKSGTGTDDQLVSLLRSQILTLRQENDNLKEKLQYENGMTNGMPSLSQSPLTHSISVFSEGESGILMNGERSRTPSDEGDVPPKDESNVQEENQILKETIKKMQVTYSALVEAGDKLQVEYDQLYDEKMALEEKLQELTKEKEELTKENNILAAENLNEDIEKLFSEIETLQQKNKQLEKEKEASRHPLNLSVNPGLEASGELARIREERDALKLKCDELEETATRLKHDHDIVIEEIQSVQERFSDVQTDRDQLQQELDLMQDELEKLTQQYEVVQQEYNQLEQDYAELLAEKGKLEQDILNLESGHPGESNQTFSSDEQEILIQQNSVLSEEKEVLENKVLKLETAKQMLETELEIVKDKANSFRVKVSDDNQNILTSSPNSAGSLPTSPVPNSSEKDKQIRSLQVKISRLQQQVTEMERKHKDTVNTYRTHLISAVQGRMHPEIREALHHIIDLRSKEEYC